MLKPSLDLQFCAMTFRKVLIMAAFGGNKVFTRKFEKCRNEILSSNSGHNINIHHLIAAENRIDSHFIAMCFNNDRGDLHTVAQLLNHLFKSCSVDKR